jgi:hypothetical protein
MQALTNIEGVRGGRDKLRSEPAKKREHVFSCTINEYDFREIYNQLSCAGACYQHPSVFGILTSEFSFQLQA